MQIVSSGEVLKYVNEARTNPQKFATYVQQEIKKFFNDNRTLPLVPGCNYSTNEGKGAWSECLQFLKKQKPMEPYKLSKGLSLSAEDHAADMAANNFQGHTGSDGSQPGDRINRRCEKVVVYGVPIASGQNIGGDFMYEGRNFALNTVKSLIIDDGVSNRGHRKNIFSQTFHYIGIGSRVVGDRVRVVMNFHSHDPAVKDNSKPSQVGVEAKLKKVPQQEIAINSSNNKGGKYAVSTQTSTKTKTVNGKTTKVTTQTIKYSDGSIETNERTQTHG